MNERITVMNESTDKEVTGVNDRIGNGNSGVAESTSKAILSLEESISKFKTDMILWMLTFSIAEIVVLTAFLLAFLKK